MNGGYVRITAPCGADQTAHEQAIEWILDRHAHAHNKGRDGHRPARHPISPQHRGDFTAAGSGQHHGDEHTVSSLLPGLPGLAESGQPEADTETGWEACA